MYTKIYIVCVCIFTVYSFGFFTSNWTLDVQGLSKIGLLANSVVTQMAELEKCLRCVIFLFL